MAGFSPTGHVMSLVILGCPLIFTIQNTSRFCRAGPSQDSEQDPHGPVNHCPAHVLSLEHALEVSGFTLQFASGHTAKRLWVPVPQASEH